jgi:hypothetical protein
MVSKLAIRRAKIADLCRRFHVRRLDLFGSAARETDFLETSDVDLLVEYEPTYSPPALSDFFALRSALSDLLDRKIDLTMAGAVRNPFVRASIEHSRQPLYGA